VSVPSLSVLPPWLSSRYEVNTMGFAAVPWALSVPLTVKLWPPGALTIWPGAIVNVAPVGTVTDPDNQ